MSYARPDRSRREYSRDEIVRIAESSLINEVMTTPKPGLVDAHDNGAHTDMNKDTFVLSSRAIAPYIADMFFCGLHWDKEIDRLFPAIVPIGIEAEKAMFQATEGVNTHKGAIFTMGILSAAAGYNFSHRFSHRDESEKCYDEHEKLIFSILEVSGEMMKKAMAEVFAVMRTKVPQTHGEKLFALYGEKGIRGEAELGFPIIKEVAFPLFQSYMDRYPTLAEVIDDSSCHYTSDEILNDSSCHYTSDEILNDPVQNSININVLLGIMTKLSDTCVLSRSDQEGLFWIQKKAAELSDLGGAFTEAGIEEIIRWNQECIDRNISPGGAADILAVTIFLWRITSQYS